MKAIKFVNSKKLCLVDDEDFHIVNAYDCYLTEKGQAIYRFGGKTRLVSRLVMRITDPNIWVDHINFRGWDNQKSNLRPASISENDCYRRPNKGRETKFKGFCRDRGKWKVTIMKNGISYNLGRFDTEEEAAKAYNEAAKKLHGKFAKLNKI